MFCRRRFSQVCTSLPVTQKMSSAVLKKCQASNFCGSKTQTGAETLNFLLVVPVRPSRGQSQRPVLQRYIIVSLGSRVKYVCSRLLLQVDTVKNNLRRAGIDPLLCGNLLSRHSFYLHARKHKSMITHGCTHMGRMRLTEFQQLQWRGTASASVVRDN